MGTERGVCVCVCVGGLRLLPSIFSPGFVYVDHCKAVCASKELARPGRNV